MSLAFGKPAGANRGKKAFETGWKKGWNERDGREEANCLSPWRRDLSGSFSPPRLNAKLIAKLGAEMYAAITRLSPDWLKYRANVAPGSCSWLPIGVSLDKIVFQNFVPTHGAERAAPILCAARRSVGSFGIRKLALARDGIEYLTSKFE